MPYVEVIYAFSAASFIVTNVDPYVAHVDFAAVHDKVVGIL